MHHLAKVYQKYLTGEVRLQLLARQMSESLWELLPSEKMIDYSEACPFHEGSLVLLTLDPQNQVSDLQDATPWVLNLISQYLMQGITPEFLAQEHERAEQWRQSLTLQSQEVRRRAFETAARRDEIQALEKKLRLEQEELERRESELQTLEKKLSLEQESVE